MPTVLVVDDAAAERIRISGITSRWNNCEVLQADNGKSAMELIESHFPDLVLTDLHMPEMNGLELVAAVKGDFPNIPVILMTAKGSEDIAAQALRSGAASYVPKLRLAEDLIATLDDVYDSVRESRDESRLMHYLTEGQLEFVLPNDLAVIKMCVSQIRTMIRCVPLGDESERLRVSIAVQEAMLNAFYHGNLEVAAEAGDDASQFDEVAQRRRQIEPYVFRKITVQAKFSRESVEVTVKDEGPGFDTKTACLDEELSNATGRRGRGLRLITSVMDEVSFNDSGNEIRLLRRAVQDEDFDDDDE